MQLATRNKMVVSELASSDSAQGRKKIMEMESGTNVVASLSYMYTHGRKRNMGREKGMLVVCGKDKKSRGRQEIQRQAILEKGKTARGARETEKMTDTKRAERLVGLVKNQHFPHIITIVRIRRNDMNTAKRIKRQLQIVCITSTQSNQTNVLHRQNSHLSSRSGPVCFEFE